MLQSIMDFQTRPLSSLHTWEKNPRSITKNEFIRLKKLISTLGLFKPFLITEDGTVLGGNMRLRAAQELGITDAPVSIVEAKDDQKKLEYALADNDRVGEYDQQQLAELIASMPEINLEEFHVDLGRSFSLQEMSIRFGPENFDGKNQEIDTESLGKDLDCECPRCHFHFTNNV